MTREVMQQALEALESSRIFVTTREKTKHPEGTEWYDSAITALREALAQPEQEPVAFYHPRNGFYWAKPTSIFAPTVVDVPPVPLYTVPPAAQPVQEFVEHTVIAGALFDFMGYLTSRRRRIVLSAADEASPAVDAINDFAKMRGLSLGDAQVLDWQDYTTPPAAQRQWVGLTDEEIWSADPRIGTSDSNVNPYQILINARAIEAKLKEKNT
jgi:hypothetical protein